MSTQGFFVTMRSVAIIFFELGVVKHFRNTFNRKTLHDYNFILKLCLIYLQLYISIELLQRNIICKKYFEKTNT